MSRPGIARVHRHGVELPLKLAGLRIERLQEARRVQVVAGAGDHVVADDDRRRGREVLLVERRDLLVPALLARLRFERDEIVVRRFHVEEVVPDADAAVGDVGAAASAPEVVPELASVARIEGPGVVRRRHIDGAVDHERRALDGAVRRDGEVAFPFAAGDDASSAPSTETRTARPVDQPRRPGEREALHGRLIDLFERAVAASGVVARIGRP